MQKEARDTLCLHLINMGIHSGSDPALAQAHEFNAPAASCSPHIFRDVDEYVRTRRCCMWCLRHSTTSSKGSIDCVQLQPLQHRSRSRPAINVENTAFVINSMKDRPASTLSCFDVVALLAAHIAYLTVTFVLLLWSRSCDLMPKLSTSSKFFVPLN